MVLNDRPSDGVGDAAVWVGGADDGAPPRAPRRTLRRRHERLERDTGQRCERLQWWRGGAVHRVLGPLHVILKWTFLFTARLLLDPGFGQSSFLRRFTKIFVVKKIQQGVGTSGYSYQLVIIGSRSYLHVAVLLLYLLLPTRKGFPQLRGYHSLLYTYGGYNGESWAPDATLFRIE